MPDTAEPATEEFVSVEFDALLAEIAAFRSDLHTELRRQTTIILTVFVGWTSLLFALLCTFG